MENSALHRRERIIITTIEIIDELGFQGLSTREIARRQGVSEATLFRHFKNKNDLLISVLNHFSKFDDDIFESAKLNGLESKEAIIFFITSYLEYYENYPAITSILHLFDVLRYDPQLTDTVNNILRNRTSYLKQLIDNAIAAKEISSDMNSDLLSDVIYGSLIEICLKWRLEGRSFSLKERTLAALEMVLNVFQE